MRVLKLLLSFRLWLLVVVTMPRPHRTPHRCPRRDARPPPELAMACSDALADVYTLPSNLPAMDDTHRGDVFRCATTESLSAYKVNKQIDAYNIGYMNTVAGHATSRFCELPHRVPLDAQHGRCRSRRRRHRGIHAHPREAARGCATRRVRPRLGRLCAPVRTIASRPRRPRSGSGLSADAVSARGCRLHRHRPRLQRVLRMARRPATSMPKTKPMRCSTRPAPRRRS